MGLSSSLNSDNINDGERTNSLFMNEIVDFTNPGFKGFQSRKRRSNDSYEETAIKRIRSDIDPVCVAINNIALAQSLSNTTVQVDSPDCKMVNGKTKSEQCKGKGKHKYGNSTAQSKGNSKTKGGNVTNETSEVDSLAKSKGESDIVEQLASGDIHKDDISRILFRLPNGTRLQKNFMCEQPLQVSITP